VLTDLHVQIDLHVGADMELGRRERQIMDAVYRLGRATVAEVRAELPDAPSYSAVRGMLRFLEDKGLLRHDRDGLRYVYIPTVAPAKARKSALRHLVRTFFGGSAHEAVAALLEDARLSPEGLRRLEDLVEKARKEGK
jgi:BlaI family transcriptional regulator, penicillinase repressor